jgi:hypothetical protein
MRDEKSYFREKKAFAVLEDLLTIEMENWEDL